jgi:3-phenylpropionate/cinnamic acid dioxygenase small subunit
MSDAELLAEVSAFLYLEARLADESRYQDWLDLWTDDAHYWVPSGMPGEVYDRDRRISFVNDNRNRLTTRIRQLQTGVRWAQTPPSPMRRVVSNIELLERPVAADEHGATPAECLVGSNFVLYELSAQATNDLRVWAGRATHRLRRPAPSATDGWRMVSKVVELVNASQPLPSLAFLL